MFWFLKYILDIDLPDEELANIFFHSIGYLFSAVSFASYNLFSFMSHSLPIFIIIPQGYY